jgi:hypothetical protein
MQRRWDGDKEVSTCAVLRCGARLRCGVLASVSLVLYAHANDGILLQGGCQREAAKPHFVAKTWRSICRHSPHHAGSCTDSRRT